MQHLSVLVVGNDPNWRVSAARVLKASGFLVFEAMDAPSALQFLRTLRMSAVLLDGDHLAGQGSCDLLGFIAKQKPSVSLVYLTVEEPSRVPAAAMASIVRMPCDPSRLPGVLRTLCQAA